LIQISKAVTKAKAIAEQAIAIAKAIAIAIAITIAIAIQMGNKYFNRTLLASGDGDGPSDSEFSNRSDGSKSTVNCPSDGNSDESGEDADDLVMDGIVVDEAASVEVKIDNGAETIYVGPSTSTERREWKHCTVEHDPSVQGDRRFKGICKVNWNGTELQKDVKDRTPLDYFKKAFPISYLDNIEEYTNEGLKAIYQNLNPTLLASGELLHVLGIRLAMTLDPKKGGLDIHWDPYDEDTVGVILGGNFKQRFITSKSRFTKIFQAFQLENKENIKRNVTADPWAELRPFYNAVNVALENSITPGATIVVDESMSSWHGLSASFDAEGCPHVTKIQRKPEGIGVEYKALADGYSGVLIKLEVMEGAERMNKLEYADRFNAGTASLLRLTKSTSIQDSWRVVVGDSAFGSVPCAVAMDVERGLYFMGAIKTAHAFFPAKYLHTLVSNAKRGYCHTLQSAYESRNGEKRVILATVWNDKKDKLIISTCGTTSPAQDSVRPRTTVRVDSETGELVTYKYKKTVPRSNIVFKFHEYFGAVDIHNHLRQGSLAFERNWKTKKFSHRFFMTLLGICITNAFRMYELEYKESHHGNLKYIDDFTTFLDKLAYEMIFNDSFGRSNGSTKRGFDDINNSSSKTKKKQQQKKSRKDDDDDADDEDDEGGSIHQLMSFAQKFPDEAATFKQTLKHNCKMCNSNKHRTTYFCLNCSIINNKGDDKHKGLFWICSPLSERSDQCYAKHVLGKKSKI
jgi:hypothetical protein